MPVSRASINAKRSERRRSLATRLELAEQDAGVPRSEEQPAKSTKPTLAPYLVEEKAEPESSEEHESEPSPVGASAAAEEPAETLEKEPGAVQVEQIDSSEEGERPSAWLGKGRHNKMPRGGSSTSAHGPVRLRTAKEAGRARAKGKLQEAPWRSAGSSGSAGGHLAGGRGVAPRWKIEGELERAERGERGGRGKGPSSTLLSKAATQLLRWGRTDIRGAGSTIKTIKLQGWAPRAWFAVSELASALEVRAEQLCGEVLQSMGSHGPRVEYQERDGDQEPRVRACWAGREEEA